MAETAEVNPLAKFDAPALKAIQTSALAAPAAAFLPATIGEAMEVAKLMAASSFVPPYMRGKTGDCLAVVMQATRWQMDPFAVAAKCYFVNDRIAYEAQLINAVVNTRAKTKERLKATFSGEGPSRRCSVVGWIIGDTQPSPYESPKISDIKPQNSSLWKSDPDQQLCYYSMRAWARRYVPEVIMGVYAPEELDSPHLGADNAKDVTPPRPKMPETILDSEHLMKLKEREEEMALAATAMRAAGGSPVAFVPAQGGQHVSTEQEKQLDPGGGSD